MRMVALAAVAAGMMVAGAPAMAATVYSNNFDAENGGNTQLNFNGFNGLTVNNGTVDIISNTNNFGITCAGNSGSCVDLDGSTGDGGELLTTGSFAFNAGDLVTLSFDLSGSQRGDDFNPFSIGFRFGAPTGLATFTAGGAFGNVVSTNISPVSQAPYFGTSFADDPFRNFTLSFRPTSAGTFQAFINTASTDSIGPVLDNLALTIAVPEPATWAMMIVGVGGIGGALRRRRRAVLATA